MSASVRTRTTLCTALLGAGLLALTGCSGGATASLVEAAGSVATSSASATASASTMPTPATTPTPVVTVSDEWQEEPIGFTSRRQDDPTLDRGVEALAVAGVAGVKATRFEVTLTDGVETGRRAVGEEVRRAPVEEVVSVGSKAPVVVAPPAPAPVVAPPAPAPVVAPPALVPAAGGCDPNYDGDCVPIDSDVDCAGGSGNGPSYVQGPVRVIGTDIYGLDGNDNDGLGCE